MGEVETIVDVALEVDSSSLSCALNYCQHFRMLS